MSKGNLPPKVGFIWDIDGIVVDSPHEDAWRITAAKEPWCVAELSSDFYFAHVASRSRHEGGNNILHLKGVYERLGARTQEEKDKLLDRFCTEKDALVRELVQEKKFKLFPDAVTLLLKAKKVGVWQAAASASKNAGDMLALTSRSRVIEEVGEDFGVMREGDTLYSMFEVDACGIEGEKEGIQKFAADRLRAQSGGRIEKFVVFEDAPSGVGTAKSLGFYPVGILRIGDEEALRKAGAEIVVKDLRRIKIEDLISAS